MLVWTSKRPYEGLAGGRFPNVFAAVAGGGASCGDCDDGNPCTQDSCDSEGVCQHADAPAMACRAGTKSALLLKNASMSWKLSGAQATSQDELSDPTTTAAYVMCVYDESGTRARLDVPAAGSCGTKSCWKAISTKGYAYKDASAANDGVSALVLKGSTLAKTKAILKGAGTGLPSVALPLSGGVAVQLHNLETGTCLGSVFSENDILVNDGVKGLFKAVAK